LGKYYGTNNDYYNLRLHYFAESVLLQPSTYGQDDILKIEEYSELEIARFAVLFGRHAPGQVYEHVFHYAYRTNEKMYDDANCMLKVEIRGRFEIDNMLDDYKNEIYRKRIFGETVDSYYSICEN